MPSACVLFTTSSQNFPPLSSLCIIVFSLVIFCKLTFQGTHELISKLNKNVSAPDRNVLQTGARGGEAGPGITGSQEGIFACAPGHVLWFLCSQFPVGGKSEAYRLRAPRPPDLLGSPPPSSAPRPPSLLTAGPGMGRAKPRGLARWRSLHSRARGGRGALTLGCPVCFLGCDLSAEHKHLGNSSQNLHCFNSGARRERNQGLDRLPQP